MEGGKKKKKSPNVSLYHKTFFAIAIRNFFFSVKICLALNDLGDYMKSTSELHLYCQQAILVGFLSILPSYEGSNDFLKGVVYEKNFIFQKI